MVQTVHHTKFRPNQIKIAKTPLRAVPGFWIGGPLFEENIYHSRHLLTAESLLDFMNLFRRMLIHARTSVREIRVHIRGVKNEDYIDSTMKKIQIEHVF